MPITLTPDQLYKFVGRTDTFNIQTQSSGFIRMNRTLTLYDLVQHMNGVYTCHAFVINSNAKCKFGVIDIDYDKTKITTMSLIRLKTLGNVVLELFPEFERILEFSGRRGFHIWIFFKREENPAFVQEFIKSRLKKMGLRFEVFPKQHTLSQLEKQLGNTIKIPCGIHVHGMKSIIMEWIK